MDAEGAFQAFFAKADLVICDTMYSLGETVSLKQDLGHSSNVVAVDLCHAAGARRLALFHHEPSHSDEEIQRMHADTFRYEELVRGEASRLEVVCAYDGLEVEV
jgi:ribonuclease BN (tRNA processing enzyme)